MRWLYYRRSNSAWKKQIVIQAQEWTQRAWLLILPELMVPMIHEMISLFVVTHHLALFIVWKASIFRTQITLPFLVHQEAQFRY